MDVVIKKATIIHQGSDFHLQVRDIHIADGIIKSIAENIDLMGVRLIEGNQLHCCIGLCDIGTHSGEPGYEHRESVDSLTKAALAGGYTSLAIFPNNKPVTQTKADIRYLAEHSQRNGVDIHPIGALSKDIKGVDIAEYIDMVSGGAIAISDGMKSVSDTGLLGRALHYASKAGAPIIHHPDDSYLSAGGEMHEGEMSTSLGMKGVPYIAELHIVERDILLNEYYKDSALIEHGISSARSVDAIRKAKVNQSRLYATVPYMNLIFTDKDLWDFDSNLKVTPVLRSEQDRIALIEGLKDNTIDAIISNHTPLDEETKNLEFPYALPGATGLETCLMACLDQLKNVISVSDLIYKLTFGPRLLLQLAIPEIRVGAPANLCIFDLNSQYSDQPFVRHSLSNNHPFAEKQFTSRVVETIKF